MTFEWTVSIGAIISVLTVVFTIAGFYFVTKRDISDIKSEIQILREVVVKMAVQTERLNNLTDSVRILQADVADLRRGRGFIKEETDREYR